MGDENDMPGIGSYLICLVPIGLIAIPFLLGLRQGDTRKQTSWEESTRHLSNNRAANYVGNSVLDLLGAIFAIGVIAFLVWLASLAA